ncbi:hypothetical protein CCMA1212_005567 [Trichoderma ghanense]|uniref:Uncharacterized protein n=1 Tax=Trichoderma ghanense TaxID=65468 RepID=A0ABY2H4V6_9HYPO
MIPRCLIKTRSPCIISLYGHSDRLNQPGGQNREEGDEAADFTKSFLMTAGITCQAKLERDDIAGAGFITTTPVAVSGSFSHFFHLEIVFMYEAPHTRGLTTLGLIPLAYFDPVAWEAVEEKPQTG